MGLKEKLPGMRAEPGNRVRNILFGAAYVFLALTLLSAAFGGGEDVESSGPEAETNTTEAEAEASEGQYDESDGGDGGDGDASTEETESESEAGYGDSGDGTAEESSQSDGGDASAEEEETASQDESTVGPAEMEAVLQEERDLDVYVMDGGDGTIEVDYYSYAANDPERLAGDIGAIAGAYSAVVDSGYETDEMVINVKTPGGEDVGEYRADADDAQAYQDGEITAEEYGQRVLATGEVYD